MSSTKPKQDERTIQFVETPDCVGLGRVIVDGQHYGLPLELVKIFSGLMEQRRLDEQSGRAFAVSAKWPGPFDEALSLIVRNSAPDAAAPAPNVTRTFKVYSGTYFGRN